ncbi:MAG: LLM class flavin-dependent oxidoreductase [Proteobacteria bacterium]|nr:LLM class flavin-dependent oxidoreductase [Pseudomonadota bacterium]
MNPDGKLRLSALVHATGSHPASWLHPDTTPSAANSIESYVHAARVAEAGKLDLFFIADTPAARTDNLHAWSRFPMFMNCFEPVTLLSALSGATKQIGLGGTVSTSFFEPYNVARQFASLDHLSHGRAAWNVVTSANDYAARNFGLDKLPEHGRRYDRAREFVEVVSKLWDTWEDDAFIFDRKSGVYFDPTKQHAVDHKGNFFELHGALNIARSPQGRPVIIQAGASDTGRDFAAQTAEVVFGSDATLEAGKKFYKDVKARMAKFGRHPDELKILAGLTVIVGESQQEAEDKFATLQGLIHPDVGRMRISSDLEVDLSDLPLDEPIPEERIPKTANLHKAYFDHIVDLIRREKLTLRQLYLRYERGRKTFAGNAKQVADVMEQWYVEEAADGFMLVFQTMPTGLEDFTRLVVPELQRRGLFRKEYEGRTLRDNLGLKRPANRHATAGSRVTRAAE